MTTDTDAPHEKIATEVEWHIRTACARGYAKAKGTEIPDGLIDRQIENVVHTIWEAITAEVRAAKAEAWDEGNIAGCDRSENHDNPYKEEPR